MNKWIGIGRLTRDPEVRYSQGENATAVARFNLAVDRRFRLGEQQTADFISCVAFGKVAERVEKWCRQGTKIVVEGHIQTGSYTDKDGNKRYTTDVVVENWEFGETKAEAEKSGTATQPGATSSRYGTAVDSDGFLNIPDGIDEELPF